MFCRILFFFSIFFVSCLTHSQEVDAEARKSSKIEIINAWVREAPPGARSHGAYLTITNRSDDDVKLISIFAEDYAHAMIHQTVEQQGMMSMMHVSELTIYAGEQIELAPGAMHVMLMGPAHDVHVGDKITFTLCFSDDSHYVVEAVVKK